MAGSNHAPAQAERRPGPGRPGVPVGVVVADGARWVRALFIPRSGARPVGLPRGAASGPSASTTRPALNRLTKRAGRRRLLGATVVVKTIGVLWARFASTNCTSISASAGGKRCTSSMTHNPTRDTACVDSGPLPV
jgi:hypothetical protein